MMKRTGRIGSYIGAAVLLAVTAVGAAAAPEKAGDVVFLRGKAQIERADGAVAAQVRAVLREADSVATRDRSRIKMLFRDDSILTLGSNSRLVIRKYLYDPGNRKAESIYELADGRLRSVVNSPGFKVTTPTAFAAARGTLFTVAYDADANMTRILVTEGEVEVRNADPAVAGSQIVRSGEETSVSAGQPPTPPAPFAAEAFDDHGADAAEVELEDEREDGLLHDLRERIEKVEREHPIEQEPAHTTTRTTLDIRFR